MGKMTNYDSSLLASVTHEVLRTMRESSILSQAEVETKEGMTHEPRTPLLLLLLLSWKVPYMDVSRCLH